MNKETHMIVLETVTNQYLDLMPQGAQMVLLSYDPQTEKATCVSTVSNIQTTTLLRECLQMNEERN